MAPRNQQSRSTPPPASAGPDLYAELGLARDASIDDVKRAYRRLALQCHPDKCPGDDAAHEKFQRISMAYSVLSDPPKRHYYDQSGTTEGLDISPDEFMDMFQSLLLEIIGGADMIRDMLSCFTPRELSRLPPFPFPKELFPPGTFPPGLRFSSKGLKGLPPQVEELIQGGDLHAMFAAMSETSPPRSGNSRRAAGGRGASGSSSSGGSRPRGSRAPGGRDRSSGPFCYGRRGAAQAATSLFGNLCGGPGFGFSFDDIEFGGSDSDDGGSGDSSESEWTDVSESELEAVMGQQRGAVAEGGPDGGPEGDPALPAQGGQAWAAGGPERDGNTSAEATATVGSFGAPRGGGDASSSGEASPSPQERTPSPSPVTAAAAPPPQSQSQRQSQSQSPLQALLVRDWIMAARSCDVGALARLLEQEPRLLGCRGTGMGHTALHWCAAKGSVEGVGWLLRQGMDVNVRNDDGATALHAAARNGRLEAVEALLSWRPAAGGSGAPGAPAAATSAPGASAAFASGASAAGPAACSAARSSAVCDLAAVDGEGRTALQLALEFQHMQVTALLLQAAAAADRGSEMQASQPGTAAAAVESMSRDGSNREAARSGGVEVAPLRGEASGGPEAPEAAAVDPVPSLSGSAGRESCGLRCHPSGRPSSVAMEAIRVGPGIEAPVAASSSSRSDGRSCSGDAGGVSNSCSEGAAVVAALVAVEAPEVDGVAVSMRGQEEPGTTSRSGAVDEVGDMDPCSAAGMSSRSQSSVEVGRGFGGDMSTGDAKGRHTEGADETGSRQPPPPPPPPPPPEQQQRQSAPAAPAAAAAAEAQAAAPSGGNASDSGGGGSRTPLPRRSSLTPEEKAARRAALLAADAAAEREEARREAQKAAQAEAAAAAAGLRSREEGKAWLEAARRGDLAALQRMLADNPRLLCYQGQGTNFAFTLHTALHWAVAKGHAAVARWLLQQGANPDLPNAAGATPLHAAASQQADDCARLLVLEAAAKMGVPDSLGDTVRDILLRRDTEEGGSSGGGGARLASELELLARMAALRDAPGGSTEWSPRAMRSLLAAAGVNIAGLFERRELVDACKELIGRYPPRIAVTAAVEAAAAGAGSAAAAGQRSAQSTPEPAAAAAVHTLRAAAAEGERRTSGAAGGPRVEAPAPAAQETPSAAASPSQALAGGDGGGDGADGAAAAAAATAASDAAKQRGNEAFSRGDFPKAVSHYTMALRLRTEPNAVLYSNRSAAYCGMSYFGKAQADAEEAIRLDPQQPKYRCRLGVALLGQLQFREAEAAFRAALQLDPSYAAAVQGLADVRAAAARNVH